MREGDVAGIKLCTDMREGDVAGIKQVEAQASPSLLLCTWFIEAQASHGCSCMVHRRNSSVEASATCTLISRICQCLIVCKELRFCSLLKMIASVARFEF